MEPVDPGIKFQYAPARFSLGGSGTTSQKPSVPALGATTSNGLLALKSPTAGLNAFRSLTSKFVSKLGASSKEKGPKTPGPKTPAPASTRSLQEREDAPKTAPGRLEATMNEQEAEGEKPEDKDEKQDASNTEASAALPTASAEGSAQPAEDIEDDLRLPPMLESTVEYIAVPAAEGAPTEVKKAAPLESEADIEAAGERPYWMQTCRNISSPMLRLHQGKILLELVVESNLVK
eukprot:gene1682-33078_t